MQNCSSKLESRFYLLKLIRKKMQTNTCTPIFFCTKNILQKMKEKNLLLKNKQDIILYALF